MEIKKRKYQLMGFSQLLWCVTLISMNQFNDCAIEVIELQNGNKIEYQVCFNNHEETIVFIHAGGLNLHMWEDQVDDLKTEYNIITYSIRGHGGSSFSENSEYDILDLIEVLNQINEVDQFHLVGCSLGSMLALDFTINYPEKIKKLVLISPGLIGLQEKNPLFLSQMGEYVNSIQLGDEEEMLRQLKSLNAIGKGDRQLPDTIDKYVTESLGSFISTRSFMRATTLKTANPINFITQIEVETLIIVGELDHSYIHENAKYFEENLLYAKVKQIGNAGHLPNMEQPERTNQILSDFFNSNK